MSLYKMHRRLSPLGKGSSDDTESGFALIYSVLLILVVTGLATAVLGLVVAQIKPTQLARKRQQTLNSAEAGIQAVINRFRASTQANGAGLLSALPQCTSSSPKALQLSGTVDGSTDSYNVTVYYLQNPPAGMSLVSVQNAAMTCNPLTAQPNYAVIVSAGAGAALDGRTPLTTGNCDGQGRERENG